LSPGTKLSLLSLNVPGDKRDKRPGQNLSPPGGKWDIWDNFVPTSPLETLGKVWLCLSSSTRQLDGCVLVLSLPDRYRDVNELY
jgi:hypothetical protein